MTTQPPTQQTSLSVITVIVVAVALAMFTGLTSTVYLIIKHCDASLIAIVSGFTGTALGSLTSMLNNTKTAVAASDPQQPDQSTTQPKPKIETPIV